MSEGKMLQLLAVLWSWPLAGCTTQAEPTNPCTPRGPSVIVIVLDDVGRDDVYPSVAFTPTIESFASQGVRFERAY